MRDTLENLYFGNITPNDQIVKSGTALKKAMEQSAELEEDIENTRQEVRDFLDKMQRRRLMHLVDSQNLLKEEISLASFTAGFKLAWGLSKELEAEGLYSFDEEETERVCRKMKQEE